VNKNCCATKSGHDISCPYKEKFEANLKSGRSMLRPYKGRFEERAGFFSGLAPVNRPGCRHRTHRETGRAQPEATWVPTQNCL